VDGLAGKLLFRSQRRKDLFKDGHWMLDVVMAPSFEPEAVLLLGERRGRKLFENGALLAPHLKKTGFSYRPVRGGFLRQPPATYVLNLSKCRQEEPGIAATDLPSLLIAWAVAFSSCHGGNEIALARDGALIGAGGGPSTVEAARVAICRAADCGHDTRGAAFAADAFFPFTDAPSLLVEAGTSVGCVPAGGRHESSVMDLFTSRGMRVAYIPPEFRGFCRH
jgi:phosphoribosylaminoimidazolecarboxamide formyltransferase/IMP cyclohydrolase